MSGEYVPERGYHAGPTLAPNEDPWPIGWEQDQKADECSHRWECVTVRRYAHAPEPVVRCIECNTPRCGHSDDRDPCMERRHHSTVHVFLSGWFEPVGGTLRPEPTRAALHQSDTGDA